MWLLRNNKQAETDFQSSVEFNDCKFPNAIDFFQPPRSYNNTINQWTVAEISEEDKQFPVEMCSI